MLFWLSISLIAFVQALAASLVLTPYIRDRAARMGLMDHPTLSRKHHRTPTPRAGGIPIYFAFWGCLVVDLLIAALIVPHLGFLPEGVRVLGENVALRAGQVGGLAIGCAMIFAIGVLDDRFDLPPLVRLAGQVAACIPLLASGIVLEMFLPPILAWPLTVCWLVLLTNSFNFLDNMNGLTSGISIIVCLVMGSVAVLSREWYSLIAFSLLGGAVAGFWFFNFPKASIFLGDSGSTHLGFLLGALAILSTYFEAGSSTALPVLIPLVVFGVPIFDTLTVMLIRWRAGQPFMQGDTNHISHRLVALGLSRTEAVAFLYVATLATGLAAIPLRLLDWKHGIVQTLLIILIFFLLNWLERVSYRRGNSGALS